MSPVVLMYHSVLGLDPGKFDRLKGISVSEFEAQISWLCSRMEPISDRRLLHDYGDTGTLLTDGFYLTFDHATRDHMDVVLPILQKHGITGEFYAMTLPLVNGVAPIVDKQRCLQYIAYEDYSSFLDAFCEKVLVCTNEIGAEVVERNEENLVRAASYLAEHGFYSVEERFFRYIRNELLSIDQFSMVIDDMFAEFYPDEGEFVDDFYLNFDELQALQDAGMTIGAHSNSHPLFSKLPPALLEREIAQSLSVLSERLGTRTDSFAYPFGDFDQRCIRILRAHHVDYAFATGNRIVDPSDNCLCLPRLDAASFELIAS